MKHYVLLIILCLAMGFNTWLAARSFQNNCFFAFGINIAWDIWWVLKLIELAIEW